MFVVQIGGSLWLSSNGHDLTGSLHHALRLASADTARVCAQRVRDGWAEHVATLPERPRTMRRYYADNPATPVTVEPLAEVEARFAHHDRGAAAPAPRRAGGEGTPRPPGVTRLIYEWTLEHPEATKADALAAFPSANRSTVNVQFGAARRAQQG